MTFYDVIYLLTNVFGTYVIYKFMSIFFKGDKTNKKIELLLYILYFISIGIIHIRFNIPIINVLSNLLFLFLITSVYSSSLKLRITAVAYIYAILISIETITILVFSLMDLNQYIYLIDIELILSLIVSKILSYIVILIFSNLRMLKSGTEITSLQWIAVVGIPLGTLFSTFILMTESNNNNLIQIFLSITILFLINFFVFYLYDILLQTYQEKAEKNLLQQQNNAYMKQLKLITQSQENIRIMRHDMKLHLSTLQSLIEKRDNNSALEYIKTTYNLAGFNNEHAKSGNVIFDSILNYKIFEAKNSGIEVSLNISIPDKLNFQPIDMVIIIGNLFDNAIEATSKLNNNKKIEIIIEFNRSILYIRVINSFDGELKYRDKKLITTHKDNDNHGFGLQSVQNSIDKYHGTISFHHTDKTFSVDVLLYNPTSSLIKESLSE